MKRLGDFSPEGGAVAAGSKIASSLDFAFPGVGIVAGFIVGKILERGAKKEAAKVAHFANNVVTPLIDDVRNKRYAQALARVTSYAPGDAGEEHAGYVLTHWPQVQNAMYQAAIGAALTGNNAAAQQFAAFLDQLKTNGEFWRDIHAKQDAADAAQIAADTRRREVDGELQRKNDDGEWVTYSPSDG